MCVLRAFGRTNVYPDLEMGLDQMLRSSTANRDLAAKSLAINLMSDDRAGRQRESDFLAGYVKNAGDPERIKHGLRQYHEERIRYSRKPDFEDDASNIHNRRWGVNARVPVTPNMQLLNFLDLNGLWRVFAWAKKECKTEPGLRRFEDFSARADTGAWIHDWLSDQIGAPERPEARQPFVEDVLLALNQYGKRQERFHPTCVCPYLAFRDVLKSEDWADRCWQAAGVLKHRPTWTLVLRYPVRVTRVLARPTQLDVGTCEFHFPVPDELPHLGPTCAGHTMELRLDPEPRGLRDEFVHPQIKYEVGYWTAAGSRLGVADPGPRHPDFRNMRENHYILLLDEYRDSIADWMPTPV